MAVDRWSDVLTLVAGVIGMIVVVAAWPRRPSDRGLTRDRHPATPPPIAVKLDTIGDEPRWRVANRHGILNVTVDIVTYRPAGSDLPWVSEPIVAPIALAPGRSTTLSSVIEDPSVAHEVMVAWTVSHLDGEAQGRHTFLVDPDVAHLAPAAVAVSGPVRGLRVVYGIIAVLLCAGTLLAAWRLFDAPDEVSSAPPATTVTSTSVPSTGVPSTGVPSTTVTSTTVTPTSVPPTSVPAVLSTDAPGSAATAPPTTDPASTTSAATTVTPTTTVAPTTTTVPTATVPVDPRRIGIRGRVDNCRFGPDCLIASFDLVGFPNEGEYICEFADGTRFTFRYIGDGAEDACSTAGSAPSITIEVDGVRSATITRDSPNG